MNWPKFHSPLTMFREKHGATEHWSMTRVVAFMFAVSVCHELWNDSKDIGWPFCTVAVVTILAVPLQTLFQNLQHWFSSAQGKAVFSKLMEKVVPNVAQTIESKMTITPTEGSGS